MRKGKETYKQTRNGRRRLRRRDRSAELRRERISLPLSHSHTHVARTRAPSFINLLSCGVIMSDIPMGVVDRAASEDMQIEDGALRFQDENEGLARSSPSDDELLKMARTLSPAMEVTQCVLLRTPLVFRMSRRGSH